jgi:hypothetical protein
MNAAGGVMLEARRRRLRARAETRHETSSPGKEWPGETSVTRPIAGQRDRKRGAARIFRARRSPAATRARRSSAQRGSSSGTLRRRIPTAFPMARAGGRAQARAQARRAEHGASTPPSPTSGEGGRRAGPKGRAPHGWGTYWRFSLDNEDELTLKEIGDKYNLSRERIRQLQESSSRAARQFRHPACCRSKRFRGGSSRMM